MQSSRFTRRFAMSLVAAAVGLAALAVPALALDPPAQRIHADMVFTGRNSAGGSFVAQGTFQDRGPVELRADDFQPKGEIVGVARFRGADGSLLVEWRVICRWAPGTRGIQDCAGSWRNKDGGYVGDGSTHWVLNFRLGTFDATWDGRLHKG